MLLVGLWAIGWSTYGPQSALELEIVPDCAGCTTTALESPLQRENNDLADRAPAPALDEGRGADRGRSAGGTYITSRHRMHDAEASNARCKELCNLPRLPGRPGRSAMITWAIMRFFCPRTVRVTQRCSSERSVCVVAPWWPTRLEQRRGCV